MQDPYACVVLWGHVKRRYCRVTLKGLRLLLDSNKAGLDLI